jgi:hypothetical protein
LKLDQVFDDRESETEAAVRARRCAIGLLEPLEDVGKEICGNAMPGVAYADLG